MRTAALIVNYNMPEKTDALVEHIARHVKGCDTIVIDNGSDIQKPSEYTTVKLAQNVQTTGGWLAGLEAIKGKGYDYYWFLITSARIPEEEGDILSPMVEFMDSHPEAVGIHPSLTTNSTTGWPHLINRGMNAVCRTWMIDNIASLYRADWFDSIGWFDPAYTYAWGIDLETCYRARKQGRGIYIDDRVQIEKITNIGYQLGRMNMSADERGRLAYANMMDVLQRKWGADAWHKMTVEAIDDDWK